MRMATKTFQELEYTLGLENFLAGAIGRLVLRPDCGANPAAAAGRC